MWPCERRSVVARAAPCFVYRPRRLYFRCFFSHYLISLFSFLFFILIPAPMPTPIHTLYTPPSTRPSTHPPTHPSLHPPLHPPTHPPLHPPALPTPPLRCHQHGSSDAMAVWCMIGAAWIRPRRTRPLLSSNASRDQQDACRWIPSSSASRSSARRPTCRSS